MALLGKNLSDRETAAIYMFVFGGCDDWKRLYKLAIPNEYEGTDKNLSFYVARWKATPKVRDLIRELQAKKETLLEQERKKGFEDGLKTAESERQKMESPLFSGSFVDYSNPLAQTRKLNELINLAKDPNEALDALKVLISAQRSDKESAREGKVVRAYLPITCSSCPLYTKEAETLSHYADNVNENGPKGGTSATGRKSAKK